MNLFYVSLTREPSERDPGLKGCVAFLKAGFGSPLHLNLFFRPPRHAQILPPFLSSKVRSLSSFSGASSVPWRALSSERRYLLFSGPRPAFVLLRGPLSLSFAVSCCAHAVTVDGSLWSRVTLEPLCSLSHSSPSARGLFSCFLLIAQRG